MKWKGRRQSNNVIDLRGIDATKLGKLSIQASAGKNPPAFDKLRKSAKKASEKAVRDTLNNQKRPQPQVIARAKKQDRLVRSK